MARIEQTDWLESFVAVAEERGFSAASRALHRSQSRVSTHVSALEKVLGDSLFDRRHRPIVLTDLGQEFLPRARMVLEQLERAVELADRNAGTVRGTVVIGCHPSVSAQFLPGVLTRVHEQHPEIRVELTEQTTPDLVAGIDTGRYHLAVHSLAADPPSHDLESRTLWCEEFVAVVPRGHPLITAPQPLDPGLLAEHPLIAVARPGAAVDPDTGRVLHAWGLEAPVAWQTEQPQTVVALARSGLGVGVLNQLAAASTDSEGTAVLPVSSPGEPRMTALTRDGRRYASAAVDILAQAILDAPRPDGTLPPRPMSVPEPGPPEPDH